MTTDTTTQGGTARYTCPDYPDTCDFDPTQAAQLSGTALVTYHYATHFLRISLRTLRREMSSGRIAVILPHSGRARGYIEVAELRAWLKENRKAGQRRADYKRRRSAQQRSRALGDSSRTCR